MLSLQDDGKYFTQQNWDLMAASNPDPATEPLISALRYADDILAGANGDYLFVAVALERGNKTKKIETKEKNTRARSES